MSQTGLNSVDPDHASQNVIMVYTVSNSSSSFKAHYQVILIEMFVYVEVLRPSQPNKVMSSVVSLPNHTFSGHA